MCLYVRVFAKSKYFMINLPITYLYSNVVGKNQVDFLIY